MELWTRQHTITLLPALAVMLLIAVGLKLWLGKKSFRVRMIPIQVIAVLILLLEVGKQGLSLAQGYDLLQPDRSWPAAPLRSETRCS